MSVKVSIGQTVRHHRYGQGTVRALLDNGETARVYFDLLQMPRHIPVNELSLIGPVIKGPETPPPPQPSSSNVQAMAGSSVLTTPTIETTVERLELKQKTVSKPVEKPPSITGTEKRLIVECLRQGLPPRGNINDWTVGFRGIRNTLGKALVQAAEENGKGSVHIVGAGYGQGKSHLGLWARELALSHGLMTMNAELDGVAVTLSNGLSLLSCLFSSSVLPDTGEGGVFPVPGLGTVLKQAAKRLRGRVPRGLELFSSFLEIADKWEGNEEAVELLERFLSGDGKRFKIEYDLQDVLGECWLKLPPLKVNWGLLEDRFKAQAHQLLRVVRLGMSAGAKGALVVLDEFDHEFWYSESLGWRAQELLDRICAISERAPVVFLLLTPDNTALNVSGASKLNFPRLETSEYQQIVTQAVGAYRDAFQNKSVGDGEAVLFQGLLEKFRIEYRDQGWGPRFFVRATIEACDRASSLGVPLTEVEI